MLCNYLFSVIIVTYNCLPYLKKCINSIYKFNDIGNELQIIVVDNGNDNGETELWLKLNYTNVEYIKNENRGFGYGNNVGYRKAKGHYLLFLNPDTELVEPIFEFAVNKFIENEKIGCFGVQLLDSEMNNVSSYGIRLPIGLIKTIFANILLKLNIFIPSLMFTLGADIFIRREDFENIGLFDENIFMYYEEADICNRLNDYGKKVAFYNEKHIMHKEGKASNYNFQSYFFKQFKSKLYYIEKYKLDIKSFYQKEIRYSRFKRLYYFFMKNKNMYSIYDNILDYLTKKEHDARKIEK